MQTTTQIERESTRIGELLVIHAETGEEETKAEIEEILNRDEGQAGMIRHLLSEENFADCSYGELAEMVNDAYPDGNTNGNCISRIYRTHLEKRNLPGLVKRAKKKAA